MDVAKVIDDLRAYRAQLEEAISALENLARRRGKRRGRPPKWLTAEQPAASPAASKATRKKIPAARRKRGAANRKPSKPS